MWTAVHGQAVDSIPRIRTPLTISTSLTLQLSVSRGLAASPPRLGTVILGVGIDVVDIARFEAILSRRPRLVERLFTPDERGLSSASLAARFAAKEAVAKALGAPAGLAWQDCEVISAASGRPWLVLRGTVAAAADEQGISSWHLSLSHDAGIASALVVAEGSGA
jgi:holo-[acyl-carrier protein] synthase